MGEKPILGQGEAVCLGCRFWHVAGVPTIETAGLCRVRSPEGYLVMQRAVPDGPYRAQWPVTEAQDWCGQWEAEDV